VGITEKPKGKGKKVFISAVIFLFILIGTYLGMTIFFISHYYFGSEINGISVAGKAVGKVKEQMGAELQSYKLELKERDDKSEQITAADVGLKYNPDEEFKNFKDRQNPFKWISALLNKEEFKINLGITYDKELMKERVNNLSCIDSSKIIEPKNPGFKYESNSYRIVGEVNGNKVNKDILYEHVVQAILNKETILDLEASNCYVKPQYTTNSPEIIEARDILNKYVSSKITYTFGERKETLDGAIINNWLTVDEEYRVIFDEEKVKDYVEVLANNYNTIGSARNFVTSSGKILNVGGGDYGLSINTLKEAQALTASIKEGQTITKEPVYLQTALSHSENDIGNTYVEIDLARQYLWFYKDGSIMVEGDIVTGNVSTGHTTPEGIYKLKYKVRNTVLRGADYAAPVSYWMPFNGGIGIHDANWRSEFGGEIYKTDGSHGCINSPYYLAKTIYENIEVGMPIICYN
jgi:flagellar basal body-associated protein FliL